MRVRPVPVPVELLPGGADTGEIFSNSCFCERCWPVSCAAGLLFVIVLVPVLVPVLEGTRNDCERRIIEL